MNIPKFKQLLRQHFIPHISTLILTLLIFWGATAYAKPRSAPAQAPLNIPTSINYQGRLANSSGTPIDNPNPGLGMSFALYDVPTGGSTLWSETHANVPVSAGLFSVRLGSINPLSYNLLNGDLWLGVTVGTDAEMAPREKLAAVPFAMTAEMALTVPDGSISNNKLNLQGNLDLGSSQADDITWEGSYPNIIYKNNAGNMRFITTDKLLFFIDSDDNATDGYFRVLTNQDSLTPPVKSLLLLDEIGNLAIAGNNFTLGPDHALRQDGGRTLHLLPWGGSGHSWDNVCIGCGSRADLIVRGSVTQGAMVEANLQTPTELTAERIERFSEGDVLCWGQDELELCAQTGDPLVQAVADANGKPIVIGAERIKVLGPVKRGDLLVASVMAGYAVADNNPAPGTVIAQALEDFEGEPGLIKAMIRKF